MKDSRIPLLLLGVATITFLGFHAWEQMEYNEALSPAPAVETRRPAYGATKGMTATFYGARYCGRRTASGFIFDCQALTAAHKTLPFGTKLLVEHEGRSVVVTINDRGPIPADRDLDLSEAAFAALAPLTKGVIRVQVRKEL